MNASFAAVSTGDASAPATGENYPTSQPPSPRQASVDIEMERLRIRTALSGFTRTEHATSADSDETQSKTRRMIRSG
jgi:hypothetical protein